MKSRAIEHLLSMVFVTAVLLILLALIGAGNRAAHHRTSQAAQRFGDLSFVDFSDAFQTSLLKDVINIYYPGRFAVNDSLYKSVLRYQQKEFLDKLENSGHETGLSLSRFFGLLGMVANFLIIYLVVMALTYYGVQTLAVWRFTYKKRRAGAARSGWKAAAGAILGCMGTFLLFCPAYVIAYSIRTEFNTDTVVFMAALGVISNGVLITYANKFYAFLVAEYHKGYVDTATVKNLNASFSLRDADGIPLRAILRPVKRFRNHIFGHVFANAQFQYLSTIKEQASFLITGLIIIEMALNIHGHLSYEMLRQLLYRNYAFVIVSIIGIFYTVKLTDIAADLIIKRQTARYENS